jgi:hypothetical protein
MACPVGFGARETNPGVHAQARDRALAKFESLLPDCRVSARAVAACRHRVADEGQQPLNKLLWAVGVSRGHCEPEAEVSRACSNSRQELVGTLMTTCGPLTKPFLHGDLRARYNSCIQQNQRPEKKCADLFDQFLQCARTTAKNGTAGGH